MKQFVKTFGTHAMQLRRRLLQGTSIGLCLAMGLSLAGCGGSGSKGADVETVSEDAVYFSAEGLDYYKSAEGEEASMVTAVNCGDKIAMLINVYTYTDDMLYSTNGKEVSVSSGGVAVESVAAETIASDTAEATEPADTTEATEESAVTDSTDTTEAVVGSDEVTTEETMLPVDEPTDGYYENTTKYFILFYDKEGSLVSQIDISDTFDANTYVMNMGCNADGNLVLLTQGYDEVTYEATFLLYSFNTDGKQLGEPMNLTFDANVYPNAMAIDKEGNMYFSGYGEQGATITVLDAKGKPLFDISSGTENINGTMYLIDDVMYVDGYEMNDDEYKFVFYPIDSAGKKLGEAIDMTDLASMGGTGFYVGSDGMYYSDSIGVFSIDMETREKTALLLWKDSDVLTGSYGGDRIIVLSSDKIMIMSTIYTNMSAETNVSLLSREDKNPNAGKKIVSIAGIGISYDATVLSAVYDFNTKSDEYRVEIRDYMADQPVNSEEDYNKIISTMNMEILSGDGPDIIYGSYQSFANYEAKGLLTDMYTLMEDDTSFNKDDYIPSIFKLCESDGHLYQLGTSFMIQGFVGPAAIIGDRMGWTVDEFNEMVNSLPSGMSPIVNQTQTSLLTSSLYASMDAFVDTTEGTVSFDTDEFYQLLDYAKTYGTDDDNAEGEYVDEYTMMQNGELALMSGYISDPSSYNQYITLAGGPVSVTGFPSSDKRGPMCYMNTMLAISSESPSSEASWSFVKSFFSEEAQKKVAENYQIPVMKSVFESQIEDAMNPDETDGGMVVYDMYGNVSAMTEEAAQSYRDLVNGLNTLASYDAEIVSIIMEEVPAYFNGQKSDKDVAVIIQDRVQTLVNERE